jgi:hypothetical protein
MNLFKKMASAKTIAILQKYNNKVLKEIFFVLLETYSNNKPEKIPVRNITAAHSSTPIDIARIITVAITL